MAKIGDSVHFSSSSTDDDLPLKQKQRLVVKNPLRLTVKQPERPPAKQSERVPLKQPEKPSMKQLEKVSVTMETGSDSDAFEELESAEKCSEVCQVGNELCSLTNELFDLMDLKSILSLDAWNFSLTEEERVRLAAFLPPFEDEVTFKSNLKELLRGEAFNFGSPLSSFFDLLKSGCCEPRITCYREALHCLQKKEHYHLVRKYHNRMVNSFHEMQKLWEDYPGTCISERLEIWNSWKTHKVKPPVTRRPRHKQSVVQKEKSVQHAVLKVKPMKSMALNKETASLVEKQLLGVTRAGPKGVLRVKAPVHDDKIQPLGKVERRGIGLGPRGVLKIARQHPPVDFSTNGNLISPEGRNLISHQVTEMVMENDYRDIDAGVGLESHKRKSSKIPENLQKKRPKEESKSKEDRISVDMSRYKELGVNYSLSTPVERDENLKKVEMEARSSRSKQELPIRKGMRLDSGRPLLVGMGQPSTESKQVNLKEGAGFQSRIGEVKVEPKTVKVKKNESFEDETLEPKKKRLNKVKNVQNRVEQLRVAQASGNQKVEKKSKSIKSFDMEHNAVVSNHHFRLSVKDSVCHTEEQRLETKNRAIAMAQSHDRKEAGEAKKRKGVRQKIDIGNKAGKSEEKADKVYELENVVSEQTPKRHGSSFASSLQPLGKSSSLKNKRIQNVTSENLPLFDREADVSPALQKYSEKRGSDFTMKSKKLVPPAVQSLASSLPFSARHLLSAVRVALLYAYEEAGFDLYNHNQAALQATTESGHGEGLSYALVQQGADILESEGRTGKYSMPISEILKTVERNPGDWKVLESGKPLQDLVRGALKVLSSKAAPAGVKGWKPLASYDKDRKSWSWIGPLPGRKLQDPAEQQTSAEAWGVSQKVILKMEENFSNWFKQAQETLQQLVSSPLPPPPPMPVPMDEKERFGELRAQKSLVTIPPSSEDARAYFRMEELRRYSIPDRAFTYTAADGQKSIVAPLRRCGVKLNSKARDHFMLKPDRPSHVTILCLVRDAASRLPKSIGTRADVSALIRDSQFIMEDVSDAQVNQVVSGALDRLHYERDPCVRFDVERKLWVYLHADRQEEGFEDDGTSSTRRWKRIRKDAFDSTEPNLAVGDHGSPYAMDQVLKENFVGLDSHSPNGLDTGDATAIYSAGSTELVYSKSSSLSSPRVLRTSMNRCLVNDDSIPFMELPSAVQSECGNLQTGSPALSWNSIST